MKIKAALAIIWQAGPTRRYQPRSINGGTGWHVWDRKQDRALTDREVRAVDPYEQFAN
jgi:hypothetical protein